MLFLADRDSHPYPRLPKGQGEGNRLSVLLDPSSIRRGDGELRSPDG